MDSIFPSYPEGWLAVHHSPRSVFEAWGLMAASAQVGHGLEYRKVEREQRNAFLLMPECYDKYSDLFFPPELAVED